MTRLIIEEVNLILVFMCTNNYLFLKLICYNYVHDESKCWRLHANNIANYYANNIYIQFGVLHVNVNG